MQIMPRKPIELPPAVARAFAEDARAFFAEPNAIKHDEIAARQLHPLRHSRNTFLGLKSLKSLAIPAGLEPATRGVEIRYSIQLSYGTVRRPDRYLPS